MPMPRRYLALFRIADRHGIALSVAAMMAITIASLMPRGGVGDPGEADKIAHVLAYWAATLPAAVGRTAPAIWVAAAVIGWSGLIELVQPLIGRSGSLSDLVANAGGVAIGLVLAYFLRKASA